jgi:hypothetical protein
MVETTAIALTVLAAAPRSIGADDAIDLAWYFRRGGTDVFAVSTCGSQWERASLFARSWAPCEHCGGDKRRGRVGSGFVASKSVGRTPSGHEAELLKLLDLYADVLPPAADTECPKCRGRGYLTDQRGHSGKGALTARPSGSSVKSKLGGSVEFDGADLVRLGRVTRILAETSAQDERAAQVLAAYYGPEWTPIPDEPVQVSKRERDSDRIAGIFGVWPLTAAGKTLCKQTKQLHPLAALHNANAAQKEKPDHRRGALLLASDDQARELYEAACRVWNWCSKRPHRAALVVS